MTWFWRCLFWEERSKFHVYLISSWIIKCLGPLHFSIICLMAASLYLQDSVVLTFQVGINNWSVHVFFPRKSLHGSLAAELKRTAAGYEHLPSLVLILLNLWVLMCISTLLAITLRPKAMELMGFCLFCVYVCFEKLVRIENDAFVSVYFWWFLIFVREIRKFPLDIICNWGTLEIVDVRLFC